MLGILRIDLNAALPSGAGTFSVYLKNLTTNTTMGPATITAGNTTVRGDFYPGLTVNQGDQVVLLVSVSGSAAVIPNLEWHTEN